MTQSRVDWNAQGRDALIHSDVIGNAPDSTLLSMSGVQFVHRQGHRELVGLSRVEQGCCLLLTVSGTTPHYFILQQVPLFFLHYILSVS